MESADRRLLTLTEAVETLDRAKGGARRDSLSKRVARLAKDYGDTLGDEDEVVTFAEAVRATRNLLVHHEESYRSKAATGAALFGMNDRLEVLLMLNLVEAITGDAEKAIDLVGKSQPVLRRLAGPWRSQATSD